MQPKTSLQTFISYSRVNQQFAIRLACELKSAGFHVWMDQFDIPTGSRWDDEIEKALKESQIFLFIMTPASIISDNAKDEVGYAIDHEMRILPVLLEDCEIPLRLRRLQYVDFTQKSFNEGIKSAKELLGKLVGETQESQGYSVDVLSKSEPKTIPTKKGNVSQRIPAAHNIQSRKKSWFIYAGIGMGILAGLMVAVLVFRPYLSAPIPTATASPLPTRTPLPSPTNTIEPTSIPVTPTMEILRSFTEDFNSDIDWNTDWTLVFRHGDARKQDSFKYDITDGSLNVDISYEYVWGYFFYNPSITYETVEIEAVVVNLRSTDTFALICQFSDQGWYEFDINGGGEFRTRYVESMDSSQDDEAYIISHGYIRGFQDSIAMARENIIHASCDGNVLSLTVNDTILMKNVQSKPAFKQGQVGIAIRSHQYYPVQFSVQSIKVKEP